MFKELEMLDSIPQIFCKICMLPKQIKYILSIFAKNRFFPGDMIHTDLVGHMSTTTYDRSKYKLLLMDDATHATTEILLKKKNQAKIELPKNTE